MALRASDIASQLRKQIESFQAPVEAVELHHPADRQLERQGGGGWAGGSHDRGIVLHPSSAGRGRGGGGHGWPTNSAKIIRPPLVCRVLITRTSRLVPIAAAAWLTTTMSPSGR